MKANPRMRLGDMVDVIGGATPSTSNSAYWGGGIPWVSPKDMKVEELTGAADTVTPLGISAARLKIVPPGSILVVTRGMILAHSVPVAITRCPVTLNQDMKALLPKDGISPEFLLRMLQAAKDELLNSVGTAAHGTKKIDLGRLLNCTIPYGDADYQHRIMDILNHTASIRRLRDEARAKLREIVPALFVEMFGDPATNPKAWTIGHLGSLITSGPQNGLYRPAEDYGSGTPIVRIDSFYDGFIRADKALKRLSLDEKALSKFSLREGDILINRVNSRPLLGKSAIVLHLAEPTVFESNIMRFSMNTKYILPGYVIAALQQHTARAFFVSKAKDAINQSSINQDDVRSLPLMLPPIPLQREFADRVADIEAAASLADKAAAAAERLTQSLLAQVFGTPQTTTPESTAA